MSQIPSTQIAFSNAINLFNPIPRGILNKKKPFMHLNHCDQWLNPFKCSNKEICIQISVPNEIQLERDSQSQTLKLQNSVFKIEFEDGLGLQRKTEPFWSIHSIE
ncbi:hypothetical protein CDAR_591281 [Caerostris darwini]|uniref:Uncharacterized protein n=1 Tax=Caerostris darwini TaxID=1538125 RepID=A0AAV4RQ47_9ARAC|nr:hypothetical protein CDAR_591281 [Caerostris darwini]